MRYPATTRMRSPARLPAINRLVVSCAGPRGLDETRRSASTVVDHAGVRTLDSAVITSPRGHAPCPDSLGLSNVPTLRKTWEIPVTRRPGDRFPQPSAHRWGGARSAASRAVGRLVPVPVHPGEVLLGGNQRAADEARQLVARLPVVDVHVALGRAFAAGLAHLFTLSRLPHLTGRDPSRGPVGLAHCPHAGR